MASSKPLTSLPIAPVILSAGRKPRELLLSDELNTKLEQHGMVCLRLSTSDGQPLSPDAAAAFALSWEQLEGARPPFLSASDDLYKSKDWTYRGSPLGTLQLLTIKPPHPTTPFELREANWLFGEPTGPDAKPDRAAATVVEGRHKRQKISADGDEQDDGDGSDGSRTPSPTRPPPKCGPDGAGEGHKHGVGYLSLAAVLGKGGAVPAFEHLETHYRYCPVEEREEIFWNSRHTLASSMISSVPMPAKLATQHPWSVYHLGLWSDLPIILNELYSSSWARNHPNSYVRPPYAGTLTPYLYHAAPMSFFPMHIEEYALSALNWLLSARRTCVQAPEPADGDADTVSLDAEQRDGAEGGVAWYACPGRCYGAVSDFAAGYIDPACRTPEVLAAPFSNGRWMFDPVDLHAKGITVTRFIQRPGDIMVTAPGALHWGVNLSVVVKAAVNWASVKHWHPAAKDVYHAIQTRLHRREGPGELLTDRQREAILACDGGKKLGFGWVDEYAVDVFTR